MSEENEIERGLKINLPENEIKEQEPYPIAVIGVGNSGTILASTLAVMTALEKRGVPVEAISLEDAKSYQAGILDALMEKMDEESKEREDMVYKLTRPRMDELPFDVILKESRADRRAKNGNRRPKGKHTHFKISGKKGGFKQHFRKH